MSPRVSVIIRTKDEERWITHCLSAVFSQQFKDFEVILVDNASRDQTVQRARQFPVRAVIPCEDYRPGKALNLGIARARGEWIACLSGHCIPVDAHWLERLLRNFEDPKVAGVYGRQEPMSFTPDADKRDLLLVFGLDRRVQIKDSFFHNANSMLRRECWEQVSFDETVTNIEDRIWAQQMQARGHHIVYEPEASVYHYHGIHHSGNVERCTNVVKILERLHTEVSGKALAAETLNTVALIPVRGAIQHLNGRPLLAYTVEQARASRFIKQVIVSTDNPAIARLAQELGAEAPFLRGAELSREHVDIVQVLRYSLDQIEDLKIFPDLVVSLEVTFPFRPQGLLDDMILQLCQDGYDSVVAARKENKGIWKQTEERIVQLDEGLTPRQLKDPTFIELKGIGCVTHPEFLRQGRLLGERIGIYEVTNICSQVEVRSAEDLVVASALMKQWQFNGQETRRRAQSRISRSIA